MINGCFSWQQEIVPNRTRNTKPTKPITQTINNTTKLKNLKLVQLLKFFLLLPLLLFVWFLPYPISLKDKKCMAFCRLMVQLRYPISFGNCVSIYSYCFVSQNQINSIDISRNSLHKFYLTNSFAIIIRCQYIHGRFKTTVIYLICNMILQIYLDLRI